MDRTEADRPAGFLLDFLRDGYAISFFVEDGDGQHDYFFKLSQKGSFHGFGIFSDNAEQMRCQPGRKAPKALKQPF